jgi:phosphohistidine phosphatase
MRRLILMRHAKSSWADPGQRDLDRPLNKRGRRSAALLGQWLKDGGWRPDHALVSVARRTRETWAGVTGVLGATPAAHRRELYAASAPAMLALLHEAPDVRCLLMLGHQPGIGALARVLLAEPPDDPDFARFPTGATAVIDFDVEDWRAIGESAGRLAAFTVPRALE